MKKGIIAILFVVLFFSALWGLSEAVLGGLLYRVEIPYASVWLTVVGFSILTVARGYLPQKGMMSMIAALAMLYKFMNAPFFACHLLGILLLGICYDFFFNVLRLKNKSVAAVLAAYAGYSLFALMITYVFRYPHWTEAGLSKIANHIFVGGTFAAMGSALAVPLSYRFGQWLRNHHYRVDFIESFARIHMAVVTGGMWLFALSVFVYHSCQV
jgi:hypothetical protein